MRSRFVGPNAELIANADSNDFIGSTRVLLTLVPDEILAIPLPKKFGWNTLAVAPEGQVQVLATISSMDQIRDGNAIWVNLEDAGGDLSLASSFAGGNISQPFMYAWEHPIVAFGFLGAADTKVRVEICSKHD